MSEEENIPEEHKSNEQSATSKLPMKIFHRNNRLKIHESTNQKNQN